MPIVENSFNESLNEFEAQTRNMMSPTQNVNNSIELSLGSRPTGNAFTDINNTQSEFSVNKPISPPEVVQKVFPSEKTSNYQDSSINKQKDNILSQGYTLPVHIQTDQRESPRTKRSITVTAQIKHPNDDINLGHVRESSIPRQTSLQNNFQSQQSVDTEEKELSDINKSNSGTSIRFRPPSPRVVTAVRFTPTPKLTRKSYAPAANSPGPLHSPISSNSSSSSLSFPKQPISKSNSDSVDNGFITNNNMQNITPKVSPNYVHPVNPVKDQQKHVPKPNEHQKVFKDEVSAHDEAKTNFGFARNVSDSGISDSISPEPEEPGKILTEQMQKIEAQMKKILEHENKMAATRNQENASPAVKQLSSIADSKRNSINSNSGEIVNSTNSGYSTCSEEELKFEDSRAEKSSSFEIMEEFEDAPQEFDLNISSYSIAHPVEQEEIEKTPVPEVTDSDNYSTLSSTLGRGGAPKYRVTTPSEQMFEKEKKKENISPSRSWNQEQTPRTNQQSGSNGTAPATMGSATPKNSPFFQPVFPGFPQMPTMPEITPTQMMPQMPSMFDQFPSMPSMFDNPFQNNGVFNDNFMPQIPVTVPFVPPMPASEPKQPKSTNQRPIKDEERVIPIQIIRSEPTKESQVLVFYITI
jgi:hypothetical protein